MPVTTRAQSKRLKNVNCGYSFINTSDSLLSPMTSTILPSSNVTSSAVQTVPICHVTLASSPDQPIINRCQDHDILPLSSLSPTPSSSLVVSNFQILEISNTAQFDPGIQHSVRHSLPVSNLSTMESDCEDKDNSTTRIPKQEHLPDLNTFLSIITNRLEDATLRMTSEIHQVVASNDKFKQDIITANETFKKEVQDELAVLRTLVQHQPSTLNYPSSNPSGNMNVSQVIPSSVGTASGTIPLSSVPDSTASSANSPPVTLANSTDQVLLLLTDSFSKMAKALTEKSTESKADWPKFSVFF